MNNNNNNTYSQFSLQQQPQQFSLKDNPYQKNPESIKKLFIIGVILQIIYSIAGIVIIGFSGLIAFILGGIGGFKNGGIIFLFIAIAVPILLLIIYLIYIIKTLKLIKQLEKRVYYILVRIYAIELIISLILVPLYALMYGFGDNLLFALPVLLPCIILFPLIYNTRNYFSR